MRDNRNDARQRNKEVAENEEDHGYCEDCVTIDLRNLERKGQQQGAMENIQK